MNKILVADELTEIAKSLMVGSDRIAATNDLGDIKKLLDDMHKKAGRV
jgi:hypothetical protein